MLPLLKYGRLQAHVLTRKRLARTSVLMNIQLLILRPYLVLPTPRSLSATVTEAFKVLSVETYVPT